MRDGVYHSSNVIFMRLEAAGADRGLEFSFDSGKVVSWRPVPVPWLDVLLLLELWVFWGVVTSRSLGLVVPKPKP